MDGSTRPYPPSIITAVSSQNGDVPAGTPVCATSGRTLDKLARMVPGVAGWAGITMGLLNVYPVLYPWSTSADRLVGILICVLVSAVTVRAARLALRRALDPMLALVMVLLLITLALAAVPLTANASLLGP
jgi:hypothetical protein